jgi:hypothetical protein
MGIVEDWNNGVRVKNILVLDYDWLLSVVSVTLDPLFQHSIIPTFHGFFAQITWRNR